MKESDLYLPIKDHFSALGYTADGEVGGIDILLEKEGSYTAIELKKSLDFRSIQQAALDQKHCDFVYIGIFRPKELYSPSGRDKLYLLKRLGIGLICVSPRSFRVEIVNDPIVSELSAFQKKGKAETDKLKEEFRSRRVKNNKGGVSRTKLMTAYREDAIMILHCLKECGGEALCGQVREATGNPKSSQILRDNYYGWFEKVARGRYRIGEKGLSALEEYRDVIENVLENKNS